MDWDQINRNVENIASVGQAKHDSSYPSRKCHIQDDNSNKLHTNQFTSLTSEGAGDVSASISESQNNNNNNMKMDTAQGKFQKTKEPVF